MERKRKISLIVGIVICVCFCIPGILWYINYQNNSNSISSQIEMTENEQTVANDFENSQQEKSNETNDIDSTVSRMKDAYEKAKISTQQAMDIENEYVDWYNVYLADSNQFDDATNQMHECQQSLSDLFVGSETKYQLWYVTDFGKAEPTWVYYLGLNYSDTYIPISFVCTDEASTEKDILAIVTAKYDIQSDVLYDENIYTTSIGYSYFGVDEETEETEALEEDEESISTNQFISGVKSIADALNKYTQPLVIDEPDEIPYKYDDE